jgi:hypothetical protein
VDILFVTHPYSNYVPDLLLHGLRKLLGPRVVDYPRKDCLYRGELGGVCPDDQLCPNWFPPDYNQIDREDIRGKILKGYFKYVICDVRAVETLRRIMLQWPSGLVLVDGEDIPLRVAPGPYVVCRRETDGSDHSIPLPMALPEELLHWITSYDNTPKSHTVGFLGSVGKPYDARRVMLEKISLLYPDSLLRLSAVPSEANPKPANRLSRNDYYAGLQKCQIVLNFSGLGHDTLRFWENAACRAVHIAQRMPLFIPHDFEEGRHILRFADADELQRAIDSVLNARIDRDRIIQEGRRHLMKFHLTTARASYLLERLKMLIG